MTAPNKSTVGRVKVGSTVYATGMISLDPSTKLDQSVHSGLQMPTGVREGGMSPPRIRATMYLDDALTALGLVLTRLTTVEATFANTIGAVVDSSSTHTKYTITTNCFCSGYIDSFSVSEGGEALADVVFLYFSVDGSTDPITSTGSVAFPALTALPVIHGIGVLTINNVAKPGMTGCRYSSGLTVNVQTTDTLPFPTGGAVAGFKPRIQVDHADTVTLFTTLGNRGVGISAATSVQLYKYDASTGIAAATGSKTFTVASNKGFVAPMAGGGRHGDVTKGGCEIIGASTDGAASPFAVT